MYQNKHRSTSARTELMWSGRYRSDFKNGSDLQHLWGYFTSGDKVLCSHLGEKHHLPTHTLPAAQPPTLRQVPLSSGPGYLPAARPHLSLMVPSFPSQVPLLQHGLSPLSTSSCQEYSPALLRGCSGHLLHHGAPPPVIVVFPRLSLTSFLFLSFSSIFCPLPNMFPQKHLQHC